MGNIGWSTDDPNIVENRDQSNSRASLTNLFELGNCADCEEQRSEGVSLFGPLTSKECPEDAFIRALEVEGRSCF